MVAVRLPSKGYLSIDPVLERVERYLQLVRELDLNLVKTIDTHLHADHVTGLGALRDRGARPNNLTAPCEPTHKTAWRFPLWI